MNYIRHLTAFYEKVAADNRLNPSHISMYLALFQVWNFNRFQNPVSVCREQILLLSRIGSLHTYFKCLYNLHSWGYIEYLPSRNPVKGSLVNLCIFATSSPENDTETEGNLCKSDISGDALLPLARCKKDISGDAKMHPSINNINIVNNKTYSEEQTQIENQILKPMNTKNLNLKLCHTEKTKRKNIAAKKEKAMILPSIAEVITFFKSENFPEVEARKFFNHFESNGWKVGGKTPMKNWNAAARNWMLNSSKFAQKPKPSNSNPTNLNKSKNYGEPL
jgi:hypothetical protein